MYQRDEQTQQAAQLKKELSTRQKIFQRARKEKPESRSRLSVVHPQATARLSAATSVTANMAKLSEKKHFWVSGSPASIQQKKENTVEK